jgi:hypothetical protein
MLEQVAYRFTGESFPSVQAATLGAPVAVIVIGWKSYAGTGDPLASEVSVGNRHSLGQEVPSRTQKLPLCARVAAGAFSTTRPAQRHLIWGFCH